jgi:predicted nucleic acid-binding protein
LKICVDTTVLIDILKDEFQAYQDRFYSALEKNEDLAAPTVVYAELLPQFKGDINPTTIYKVIPSTQQVFVSDERDKLDDSSSVSMIQAQ